MNNFIKVTIFLLWILKSLLFLMAGLLIFLENIVDLSKLFLLMLGLFFSLGSGVIAGGIIWRRRKIVFIVYLYLSIWSLLVASKLIDNFYYIQSGSLMHTKYIFYFSIPLVLCVMTLFYFRYQKDVSEK